MPRTLNPHLHRVRKDAFLDAAQELIQQRGYDAMSIQDVLDRLEASRGAFYHYFDSKEALLDGVIERFAETTMRQVQPIVDDPGLPALEKLQRFFSRVADLKAEQKELMVRTIEVWNAPANAITREKLRKMAAERLTPILSTVIRQGIAEGTVRTASPEETAKVLIFMMQGFQDTAAEQFMARRNNTITFDEVVQVNRAFADAFARVLGAEPGALPMTEEKTLQLWFG